MASTIANNAPLSVKASKLTIGEVLKDGAERDFRDDRQNLERMLRQRRLQRGPHGVHGEEKARLHGQIEHRGLENPMNEEIYTDVISPAGIPRIPDEALETQTRDAERNATLGDTWRTTRTSPTGCWTGCATGNCGRRLESQEVVQRRKHHLAQAASPEILEELNARCAVVLLGVGH